MRPPISTARHTALLIGGLLVLQVAASRGSVDDAQSFALQAAEPYVKQGYQCAKIIGRRPRGWGEKRSGNSFSKATTTGLMGTEVEQAKVSVHIYDSTAGCASNPTAGKRVTSPLRTSSRRRREAILSSWPWRTRRTNGPTGRWFTGFGRNRRRLESVG